MKTTTHLKGLLQEDKELGKKSDGFLIAIEELIFQNGEKEKRAAELAIANKELVYQNEEKEKRAGELIIANKELAFQSEEKEKRATELILANEELAIQNKEKDKRASELIVANKELAFQSEEKEKRAAELIIANKELVFQNKEKHKRAEELAIANTELLFQNQEKENRAAELIRTEDQLKAANVELEAFAYSVSHDLRAPLRAIHGYANILNEDYGTKLDGDAARIIGRIMGSAKRMGQLIDDLLTFSRLGRQELVKNTIDMQTLVGDVCQELMMDKGERDIEFKVEKLLPAEADKTGIKHVWVNLISNAIKYSKLKDKAIIIIDSEEKGDEIIYSIKDNGAGFDMRYADKLFGVFQRLHSEKEFEGTGVGLAIVQRIVAKHEGRVWADSQEDQGATFYFSLPKTIAL